MREIIFDTETTGLDNREDRIIEIGAVELENRFLTGRNFHVFVNPQGKQVHPDALAVHGIRNEFLADKPTFAEVIDDWIAFTDGAKLVAHNARFDVGFFNSEFKRIGYTALDPDRIVDSLILARRRHPMGPNSLDALCKRYGIDNSKRDMHGALLDSELLAEVYIELVGGKQAALTLETDEERNSDTKSDDDIDQTGPAQTRSKKLPTRLSQKEMEAHLDLVTGLGNNAVWLSK